MTLPEEIYPRLPEGTGGTGGAGVPGGGGASAGACPINDANRLGLDYTAEAACFTDHGPIIDVHTHIGSADAARAYSAVARRYGITHVASMTALEERDAVAAAFEAMPDGPTIEFIAVPSYARRDEPGTFTTAWMRQIKQFYDAGARIIKFWAAPRGIDLAGDALRLDSPHRRESMQLAHDLGYRTFMTHVGDPDTWFATAYADAGRYGTKRQQYDALETQLDRFPDVTWIGAHLSGYPEDLDFVQGLLDRHPNFVVDTSATKWMVRELSRQPERFAAFVQANPDRVLFGSDIVAPPPEVPPEVPPGAPPPRPGDGTDVYASRYWALRTLIETRYDGPSPIVDPDLQRIDPATAPKSTARLRGCGISGDALRKLYHGTAAQVLGIA